MPKVRCQLVRWVADEPQPGLVEARLVDAAGRTWSFIDKEPIFCVEPMRQPRAFPQPGLIRCEVLDRDELEGGRDVVTIDTARPDGVESSGVTIFCVPRDPVDGD